MFKFFRQYNKIILVVGGCVLMVAFLVPQAVTMFAPGQGDITLGEVHGQEVTNASVRSAEFELSLLQSMGLGAGLPTLIDGRPLDDGLSWILLQADAREMGLWAGDAEVQAALTGAGIDDGDLAEIAALRNIAPGFVRQAVRHWLIAEQYRELAAGIAYESRGAGALSPAMRKVETYGRYARDAEQFRDNPQMLQYISALAALEMRGTHRLSRPLLTHFVRDTAASIGGRLLLIDADPADGGQPADDAVRRLFDQYKDVLPGGGGSASGGAEASGGPYPFGYRIPDRVKLEYLQITRGALEQAVNVGYAEVLDYYRQNKQMFAEQEGGDVPDSPSPVVRQQIEDQLVSREVQRLRARVLDGVRSVLAEDLRGLSEENGYTRLPPEFSPTPLDTVAERVKERFGVELNVVDLSDRWLPVTELAELEGIGFSAIGGVRGVFFPQLVAQARPLVEDPQQVPRQLRLQVGTPSEPLQDFDGNAYLFRLTAAEPAHAPASLDDVREEVVRDAKTVAAFEALRDTAAAWRQRVIDDGLDAAAGSAEAVVRSVGPFQREAGLAGEVPEVEGIGRSKAFIEAAFGLVEGVPVDADVSELPLEERVAVVPVPGRTALAVFVLESYEPLTRSGFRQQLAGGATLMVSSALDRGVVADPLSLDNLARRTGFDLTEYREQQGDDEVDG